MKFPIAALTSLPLFLLSCSQMIWKESNLLPEVSPSNANTAILVEVHYKEKDSWNPLNGTTDKKDYRTEIKLVQPKPDSSLVLKTWDIPSWALADSVFYHPENKTLILLQGKNDEYGTFGQKLSVYPETKPAFSYPATPENLVIFQISPAPNGKLIALITALSDDKWEFSEFELRILDPETQKVSVFPLSFWTALPLYGMRWSGDSSSLFVRTPDQVLALKQDKLTRVATYPECFTPSTTFGKLAFKESFVESQNPLVVKIGERLPEAKMVSSLDRIRTCP
jgi:hypothetical protein